MRFLDQHLVNRGRDVLSWHQCINDWSGLLHAIIVGSEGRCQMMAIASLARVCTAEGAIGVNINSPDFPNCAYAFNNHSFRFFVPALRKAAQVITHYTVTHVY